MMDESETSNSSGVDSDSESCAKADPSNNNSSSSSLIMESFPLHLWPYAPVLGILGAMAVAHQVIGCPDDQLDQFLPKVYHIAVCGGGGAGQFELHRYERIAYWIFALLGVFAYVIPKHLKQDGARRMYVSNKVTRVLVVHIVTGVFTVLGTGAMGIFAGGIQPGSTMFWVIAVADLLHEITILRLLKNHDGIFALRVDNAAAGFAKFQTILNYTTYTPTAIADRFFLASWGFMGTRIAAVLSWIIMFITKDGDGIYLEHTYSLGVSIAIHHIVWRASGYGTAVWLIVLPFVSYFYYHELWSRKFKVKFVAVSALLSGIMIFYATEREQFASMIAFHVWTFTQPMYYRLPKLALGGTMDAKTEEKAVKRDAAIRAIYNRESFNGLGPPEDLDVQKAEENFAENLPEGWDMGMEFRGSRAWAPSKEYRRKFSDIVDDSEEDASETVSKAATDEKSASATDLSSTDALLLDLNDDDDDDDGSEETALDHVLNNVLRVSSDDHEIPKALKLHGLTTVVDIVALSPEDLHTLDVVVKDAKKKRNKVRRKPLTLGSRNLLASIRAFNVHHVSTYAEPLDWRTVDHETFHAFRVGILPQRRSGLADDYNGKQKDDAIVVESSSSFSKKFSKGEDDLVAAVSSAATETDHDAENRFVKTNSNKSAEGSSFPSVVARTSNKEGALMTNRVAMAAIDMNARNGGDRSNKISSPPSKRVTRTVHKASVKGNASFGNLRTIRTTNEDDEDGEAWWA